MATSTQTQTRTLRSARTQTRVLPLLPVTAALAACGFDGTDLSVGERPLSRCPDWACGGAAQLSSSLVKETNFNIATVAGKAFHELRFRGQGGGAVFQIASFIAADGTRLSVDFAGDRLLGQP